MNAESHDVAVRCRGLTKSYGSGEGRIPALCGVDLDVHRGELLMLVGPSGCGKTTLVSIIAAVLEPNAGRCEVFGDDVQQLDERQRARFRGRSVGLVFQSFNLLPALSALENVCVPLLLRGLGRAPAEARARAELEAVGLGARLDALPARMSGGQQQRVAIARALVHEPKLVICDEPTSNLDTRTGRDMLELLRGLARRPERALIVVTHDPRLFDFADRVAHMDDGRIVGIEAGGRPGRAP